MAEVDKEELYVAMVITDKDNKFVAEYHLDKPVVLLGHEKGLSGLAIATIVIGSILGLLLLVAIIWGIIYCARKKKNTNAAATPGVDDQS